MMLLMTRAVSLTMPSPKTVMICLLSFHLSALMLNARLIKTLLTGMKILCHLTMLTLKTRWKGSFGDSITPKDNWLPFTISFIDSDGSNTALSDHGNLFLGNAGSDTSQDDYSKQNDEPQVDIEDDLFSGVDPEQNSFDTDDPGDYTHSGVNNFVHNFSFFGKSATF